MVCQIQGEIQTINLFDISHIIREIWNKKCRELGRKLEGKLVKGSILLHYLNSLLKHSAVLVLPLSRCDLNEYGKLITLDIPLPLKNADGSIPSVGKELGLNEEEDSKLNSLLANLANKMKLWTVGYIRLLKLFNGTKSDQFSSEEKYVEG